jgi:hypothetical protein
MPLLCRSVFPKRVHHNSLSAPPSSIATDVGVVKDNLGMFHAARVHVSAFVISFGIDVTNHLETKLHCIASDFFQGGPWGPQKMDKEFC